MPASAMNSSIPDWFLDGTFLQDDTAWLNELPTHDEVLRDNSTFDCDTILNCTLPGDEGNDACLGLDDGARPDSMPNFDAADAAK